MSSSTNDNIPEPGMTVHSLTIIVTQTFIYTASDMESPVMDTSSDDVKTKFSHSQDGKTHTCHDSSLYICF